MKGNVAVLMQLFAEQELKFQSMALMLTFDEESGGFNGVNYLLNEVGYSCDCAIVPDGGNNFRLITNQKGFLFIKISAQGKSAHGSRPWTGENALEKLINVYSEIKKEFNFDSSSNYWQITFNLGHLEGGNAVNKVPDQATALLDFRFPQREDERKILNFFDKLIKDYQGLSYEVILTGAPLVSINNVYFDKLIKAAKRLGIKLKKDCDFPASDARFFSARNIPVLMFNPHCSPGHIDGEWVDLASLEKFYLLLVEFLRQK